MNVSLKDFDENIFEFEASEDPPLSDVDEWVLSVGEEQPDAELFGVRSDLF